MADQGSAEGGRWDVGAKDGAVHLERRSEDNETLFADRLDPVDARKLAELLNKFADKAESADARDDSDDDDAREKKSKDDESEDNSDDDESDDDKDSDDDDSDDGKDSDKS
jgi:hypothetical protein